MAADTLLLLGAIDASALVSLASHIAQRCDLHLRTVAATDVDPDAVADIEPIACLIAPDIGKPLSWARRLRRHWPAAHIVIIAAGDASDLRKELHRGGLGGGNWTLLDEGAPDIEPALFATITSARRQQTLQATLGQINVHLATRNTTAPDIRRLAHSSRFLANILDTAPDGILLLDPAGIVAAWNKGAETLFGYSEPEALGRSIDFLTPESTAGNGVARVLSSIDAERRVARAERMCTTAAGSRCHVDFTAAMLADENGEHVGFSLIARDVTERKRDQDLLAAERERLAVTLHSIGDGVITTDVDGRVTTLNRVAEKLTGWSLREAVGQSLATVFHIIDEKTRATREDPVIKVLRTNEITELANHTSLIARDGTERAIADSGAPIRDKNSNVIGVVLVFRDVTEKQRTEEALLKMRQLESIGVLAGGIAHDFNNILTVLFGNLGLIKLQVGDNPDLRDLFDRTEHAFLRARDLTQQLLTFAKGGAPIKRRGSVADLVRETARFVLLGTNVKVEFRIAENLWPAEFDTGQFAQAINNIVLNARQAMPEGGTITIKAENVSVDKGERPPLAAGDYVRLTISDHGIGIAQHQLDKIFDPYFTTKQQGSGLGLATTYSIVKRHDGLITVRSTLGRGTEFDIYLPALNTQAPAAVLAAADPLPVGSGLILLMDDEEAVRQVAANILSQLGYEVMLAADGNELLTLFRSVTQAGRQVAAVILDLTVPGGMGGKEAVVHLKQLDPHAKALVSSGYFTDPVMADHAAHGFAGVVAKPYNVRELALTLQQVLSSSVK